jgi:glycosyltransferase involved in cell wall biosynthesis
MGVRVMDEIWCVLDSRGMGGIESHVAELAAGLRAAGEAVRVLFLADHGPHPLRDRLEAEGIAWEVAGGFAGLWARLRGGRPRLLHTHGYKANVIGRLAGRLAGVRVVASYHAGERAGGLVGWYDRLDRWSSGLGGRIAVSRPILARLPWGGRLVPNFVAVPERASGARGEAVAFVGRMSHEKGPDRFGQVAGAVPEARFVAFGDGAMLGEMRAAFGGVVDFRGAQAGMEAVWGEIGLLVVTSRAEGLPLAVLEAMAHGVPVAAFAVGALPEVIEEGVNGYLVAPGDVDGMAAAVRRWGGADRAALAAAARRTVVARFGRVAGVAAVRAVYAEALGR